MDTTLVPGTPLRPSRKSGKFYLFSQRLSVAAASFHTFSCSPGLSTIVIHTCCGTYFALDNSDPERRRALVAGAEVGETSLSIWATSYLLVDASETTLTRERTFGKTTAKTSSSTAVEIIITESSTPFTELRTIRFAFANTLNCTSNLPNICK